MDLYKAIQDLYAEKEKLERVIASLEELQRNAGGSVVPVKPGKRRGRKFMNPKERREVSERMKRYWERRRSGPDGKAGDKPGSRPDKPGAKSPEKHGAKPPAAGA